MAEYYPLISRAVAGLRTATPEARQAIYNRAKQALVGQLRTMEPPIPEDAIGREITALDDAIVRVEADVAGAGTRETPAAERPVPPPPLVASPPNPQAEAPPSRLPPMPRPPMPVRPTDSLARPPRREPLAIPPRPTLPPLRPSAFRPSVPLMGTATTTEPAPTPVPPTPAVPAPETPAVVLPVAPKLEVDAPTVPHIREGDDATTDVKDDRAEPDVRKASLERNRDDVLRPAAPRPAETRRPDLRVWIVAIAALAAVVAIAFTAWRLRDDPQELARVPVAATVPAAAPGKIVERADGTAVAESTAAAAVPAVTAIAGSDSSGAAAATPAPATATPAADTAVVPVAYKAAILVDAPDEPQKVKTYVGTVVWRSETVSQGQDQPIGTAIRADIDIADAKIQAVMQLRRNTEAQFPASHTIELKFTVGADSPLGGIKQISVPQLRRDDMPTGDPLSGVPVTITDNYFLVGLTRGDAESHNLELIQARGWFDIPMLLSNGKASKITFEKGAAGSQIVADVLQAWKATSN